MANVFDKLFSIFKPNNDEPDAVHQAVDSYMAKNQPGEASRSVFHPVASAASTSSTAMPVASTDQQTRHYTLGKANEEAYNPTAPAWTPPDSPYARFMQNETPTASRRTVGVSAYTPVEGGKSALKKYTF